MSRHILACSSAGGHFKQLVALVDRLPDVAATTWLTHDAGLSRDLLAAAGHAHERLVHAPYAAPRDLLNLARNAAVADRVLREQRFDLAISTGAGIAVATLPLARVRGIRACFVESATRADGPSLTGRLLARLPGIELYTQNPGYGPRWRDAGSVHDRFERGPDRQTPELRDVVVSLGTIRPYGFRRLVERVLTVLPPGVRVLWQTGATDVADLVPGAWRQIPGPQMEAAMADADVIIAHAGTGTALTAFELGRCPVLVPRRHAYGEHVDDHQVVTAEALSARGLALYAEADELSLGHLLEAAARTVVHRAGVPALAL